ncbi:MAG: adhesin [Rhodanobacteraceae bacterium]|nr:MAG: adhesin [Rhodanobacteraceae bacterium]
MKVTLKQTMLAVAIGLFCTSGAYAQRGGNEGGGHDPGTQETAGDFSQSYALDQSSTHKSKVVFDKKMKLHTDIDVSGSPTVAGKIKIDSAAVAIVDDRQKNHDNAAANSLLDNGASIGDGVASNASGNLGFNVSAGDNNQQDNAAALAATDASFVFGMADAEVFVNQLGHSNVTANSGVANNAGIGGAAFSGASGNLGANVTSGNNNQQKNALAASVATSDYAQASVDSSQYSAGNQTTNAGTVESYTDSVDVALFGTLSGTYSGDSRGNAYQANNYYPDSWTGTAHRAGSQTGHVDFDGEAQGAVLNPYRTDQTGATGEPIGGFAFDTDAHEMGDIALNGAMTGTVTTTQYIVAMASNNASLSGAAFQNASGNIGVNVSSGTGNQQANSLSLAVAQPGMGGGGAGGE